MSEPTDPVLVKRRGKKNILIQKPIPKLISHKNISKFLCQEGYLITKRQLIKKLLPVIISMAVIERQQSLMRQVLDFHVWQTLAHCIAQ